MVVYLMSSMSSSSRTTCSSTSTHAATFSGNHVDTLRANFHSSGHGVVDNRDTFGKGWDGYVLGGSAHSC
jgi:hypothetical protein